ncbi:dTMP kinase [Rhodohalobacter sp. SW132]|uniref:dTMP kinase n=1 Tax=Rhodohalobacter sp. SW132 TaxID=2293433 RepID=UPI000E22B616|nr:dTMP kinase [Rhodohalobacter sp. SW132]REL38213.1 dTMP kinase [Rhodohalobacter sp. SW132]
MFITFEGIDGSGKTTQIRLLKEYFEKQKTDCSVFREPGGTDISEQIRTLLLHGGDEMDPVTEMLLFSAARSQLIAEKVNPLLEKGTVVILDRFYDSTVAYQGYGRESATIGVINQLNSIASHKTVPDLTFYLKISADTARKRTEENEKDRMERAGDSFFAKVAAGFDKLASEESRIQTINAEQSVELIHADILKAVQAFSRS